jgi:hypothetical protein
MLLELDYMAERERLLALELHELRAEFGRWQRLRKNERDAHRAELGAAQSHLALVYGFVAFALVATVATAAAGGISSWPPLLPPPPLAYDTGREAVGRALTGRAWTGGDRAEVQGASGRVWDPATRAACASRPCLNHGTCIDLGGGGSSGGGGSYVCSCTRGFAGTNCANDAGSPSQPSQPHPSFRSPVAVGPCSTKQCLNGGRCFAERDGSGRCVCAAGWTGDECEIMALCAGVRCEHGGTCIDGDCICRPGYSGPSCINLDTTAAGWSGDGSNRKRAEIRPTRDSLSFAQPTRQFQPAVVVEGVVPRSDSVDQSLLRPVAVPSPLPVLQPPTLPAGGGGDGSGAGCHSVPCRNGGACSADHRGPTNLWKYSEGGRCAGGMVPVSRAEAEGALAVLASLLCEWCIASLADGHRISGRGYGTPLKIEPVLPMRAIVPATHQRH